MPGLARALMAIAVALVVPLGSAGAAAPPLSVPPQVPPPERARLESIARDALVSTRVAGQTHFMQPEVFEYLLDHPEFASHVTRALGLGRYRIWRDGGGRWLDDGWGTRGRFVVIHAGPGVRLYHARGAYETRFLPDMRGEAVALFEYTFRPAGDGRTLVESWATGYVQIDSGFVRVLGRVARPFVQAKADKEVGQLLKLFARASRAIENNAAQVYHKVSGRPDIPHQELDQFRGLLRLP